MNSYFINEDHVLTAIQFYEGHYDATQYKLMFARTPSQALSLYNQENGIKNNDVQG